MPVTDTAIALGTPAIVDTLNYNYDANSNLLDTTTMTIGQNVYGYDALNRSIKAIKGVGDK